MAQSENGVGISYKLSDGTMVWTRRDTWAEVTEDIKSIFGDESLGRIEPQLQRAWGGHASAPAVTTPASAPTGTSSGAGEMTVEQAQAIADSSGEQSFETCPKCGAQKDRWVAPGVSQRTGKPYPGFFGCPTQGCNGRA